MKKIFLSLMISLTVMSVFAGGDKNDAKEAARSKIKTGESGFKVKLDDKARVGLFMAFSGVDSKQEDENVCVEIYNQMLWVTNKTDKTLYLDLAECFIYNYGEAQSLYIAEESNSKKKGKDIVTEDQWKPIAPGQTEALGYLAGHYGGTYSAYEGKNVRVVNDITREFMGCIDELRIELESGKNSAKKHLTKNESFISMKAAISYRFSRKEENSTAVVVETWLSDLILAKYFALLPPQQKKERSLSAKKLLPAMIIASAESPFEYDEEKSPILGYDITIDLKKGSFTLGPIVTSEVSTNFFRLMGSVYTLGLVSPVTSSNKNQFEKQVINWQGDNLDFSEIKDDENGTATFGKKNSKVEISNK